MFKILVVIGVSIKAWKPERIVIIEFPTAERAKEWWHSEMYSKAKVIRQRAAKTKMIIVEGIDKKNEV